MSRYTDTLAAAQAKLEKNEEALKKKLSRLYDKEAAKLENEIAAYYQKYGKDGVIEYRAMMQRLTKEEATLLYENMDDFFRLHPEYSHLKMTRESIYKLNRLEGLQMSVRTQQMNLAAEDTAIIGNHLLHSTISTYESVHALVPFNQYDVRAIKQIGSNLLKASDFESIGLDNHKKLAAYMNNDIAKGIARGDDYDKLNMQIRQRFDNISRRDAYRLLYTEGTRMFNKANTEAFSEVGIDQYKYCTAGDYKVCSSCRTLKGKVFNSTDAEPGVNYPPMHPWCRCHTEPVVDWDKWLDDRISSRNYTAEQKEKAAESIKNFMED